MMRKTLLILILVCTAVGISFSQGGKPTPKVRMSLTKDTMLIGDQVQFTVEIAKDLNQDIWFPDFPDGKLTEKIEILAQSGVDTLARDGRDVTIARHFMLTSFDAGIHMLTRFPLLYLDKNITDTLYVPDSLRLMVTTFEIDTTTMSIYDIKEPMDTPLIFSEIKEAVGYTVLGLLLAAAVAYYIVRRRRRKANYRPKINVPAHVRAIEELERVHAEKLWQSNKHKQYYTRLTDIIRGYIDERYGIDAPEMTTDQTIAALAASSDVSDSLRATLRELLSTADYVKFAKYTPSAMENEDMYRNAYYFVDQTKVLNVEKEEVAQ